MEKYRVILSDNKTVIVESEAYLLYVEKGYVKFLNGEKIVAFFNFNNILGFAKEESITENHNIH